MGEFATLMACNVGGSGFQLDGYRYACDPVLSDSGGGRTGSTVTIEGMGYLSAATPAAVATLAGELATSLERSGQDVWITELSGVKVIELLAARCTEGPHIAFEISDGNSALTKRVKFRVTARTGYGSDDGQGSEPAHDYTIQTTTAPDLTVQVSIKGKLVGPPSAYTFWRDAQLKRWLDAYPGNEWTSGWEIERPGEKDQVDYTITFTQLAAPLPSVVGGQATEGEVSDTFERDEQQRVVRHVTFDLAIIGDWTKVWMAIRPADATTIVRERWDVTRHKGSRLRGEFVVLATADGKDLLHWEQSLEVQPGSYATVTPVSLPGINPFLVWNPKAPTIMIQRGRAVGLGRFPKAPTPLWPVMTRTPSVVRNHLNGWEKETSWTYELVAPDDTGIEVAQAAAMKRPEVPEFYEAKAPDA